MQYIFIFHLNTFVRDLLFPDHLRDSYFNLVPEDDIAVEPEPEDAGDYEPVSVVKREAGGEQLEQDQCCAVLYRVHNRFSQSRRRPLLGPSPG